MVARTPPKQKKIDARLNPILLREPVKKVATSCLFLGTFFLLFCLVAEKTCRTRKKKKKFVVFESFLFDVQWLYWVGCFYNFKHFSLMGFEQLSSSVLPSLGFSCLNFLSNQTEICIHISLSLTSGTVFFCFCWVKFRWMNAWLDYTRASVHSCRWNKGRIWGESKPSEYQRLSQN